MSSLAVMRGSSGEISDAPIVNGQLFIETDQLGTQDLTKYNRMYLDNNNQRYKIGLNQWESLINKPFETVGDTLSTAEDKLGLPTEWGQITNKPFETVGEGFRIVAYGQQRYLDAKVTDFDSDKENYYTTPNYDTTCGWQYLRINYNKSILRDKYIDKKITLSTTEDNVIVFEGAEVSGEEISINKNSIIEVYSSIWGFLPKKIKPKNNNTCTVVFPKYDVANTSFTCRIYIKEV